MQSQHAARRSCWMRIASDWHARACGMCVFRRDRATRHWCWHSPARADVRVTSHLDERCAAFFALASAMATRAGGLGVHIGFGGGELFPRHCRSASIAGAVDCADCRPATRVAPQRREPDDRPSQNVWRLCVVERGYAFARSRADSVGVRNVRSHCRARALRWRMASAQGVVHLNVPFRPPLEPTRCRAMWFELRAQWTRSMRFAAPSSRHPDRGADRNSAALVKQFARGLIVCGPVAPMTSFASAARCWLQSARATRCWPIALSGLRFGWREARGERWV